MTWDGPADGRRRRWDPRRPLGLLTGTGVALGYQTVVVTLGRLAAGRRVSIRTEDGLLEFTVVRLDSRLDRRSSSVGRLRTVGLEVRDVTWHEHSFERASVVLHDVCLDGPWPTQLVAAPVEVTVDVPAPALDELFRWAAPRLGGEVGPDGVARLHLARRRGSGHVEVEARLDGSSLWVTPRAVVRRRRWALPAGTPSYRVRLPELPHGLELTVVEFGAGVVRLTGTLPQWRAGLPRTTVDDLIGRLGRHSAVHRH